MTVDLNTVIPNFPIIIINNRTQLLIRDSEGVIGLGYSFTNSKYSPIHQLKQRNIFPFRL